MFSTYHTFKNKYINFSNRQTVPNSPLFSRELARVAASQFATVACRKLQSLRMPRAQMSEFASDPNSSGIESLQDTWEEFFADLYA